jgi:hypothetical protein
MAKDKMDQSMMQSEVMKAAMPNEIAKVMAEGYKIIGNMGYALLNAPEKDRDNMYQHILPMFKIVNPDAPSSLNADATSMLMLGAAQATDANILYKANKKALSSESQAGNIDVDIRSRVAKGETAETSPGLASLLNQRQMLNDKAMEAKYVLQEHENKQKMVDIQNSKTEQEKLAGQYALESKVKKDYLSESKDYINFSNTMTTFKGAIDSIPLGGGSISENAALRTAAKFFNGAGVMTDQDVNDFKASDSMFDQVAKKFQSAAGSNGIVSLNPTEIQRMKIAISAIEKRKWERQQKINSQYGEASKKYGVELPLITQQSISNTPKYSSEQINKMAADALSKGKDPAAVKQLVEQLQGQ